MANLKGKNLISITDYTKQEYIQILDLAAEFEKNPKANYGKHHKERQKSNTQLPK